MKLRSSVFVLILFLATSYHEVYAQKVVVRNGLEYIDEEEVEENLNSITVTSNAVTITVKRKKGKKISKNSKNLEKVAKIVTLRKRLRFRNKRNSTRKKCFKETKTPCTKIVKK